MKPLLERVAAGETLVSDGATGTMLLQGELEPGTCTESVCLDRPEALERIARQYVDAGAEIVLTNTLGASPIKLGLHGLADEAERINKNAVEAVRRAAGALAYVTASIGPCGKLLKPYGDVDPDALFESFAEQAKYLTESGIDAACVETMTDLTEAMLAVQAMKEVAPRVPVMATMTFDPTPRGFFTIMGVDVPTAAAGLREAGANVIGSNCGNGIDAMVRIAAAFRQCSDLPIIIQSNAGLPQTKSGKLVYDETPAFMAERVPALLDLRVSIIGGCCGTTPEHIKAIRQVLDSVTA